MAWKKMILGALLIAIVFLSFGIVDSEATLTWHTCAMGDCEFTFTTSFSSWCGLDTYAEQEMATSDPQFDYPYGLIGFSVANQEIICPDSVSSPSSQRTAQDSVSGTVTLTFRKVSDHSTPLDLTGLVYRKFGPTPDNHTPHWYDFTYDGTTGAEINGNVVTLHFVDSLRGDNDITSNEIITDPGGLGQPITSVPTMNEWGMIIFMVFAGIGSVYYLRRQRRTEI